MTDENKPLIKSGRRPIVTPYRVILFVMGLLLIVFGIAMLSGAWRDIFDAVMKKEMEVKEGSMSYSMWKKTPFPLIMNLYIWNITNHEDFLAGAKPDLQECGPYVWREHHEKKNISFYDNSTVSYMQQRWWIWDEELSGNNSRDDVIYTLNPVPISATWAVRHSLVYLTMLNKVFNAVKEPAVMRTTVNEVLFTGFKDPVLEWIQINIIAKNGTYHPLLPLLNLPPGIANCDKFGWFYMRNMSVYYDGVFNMMTGADDLHKVGQIDMWNYTRDTDYFKAPCNKVTGSAGEFFEPGILRDKVTLYSSDLCMSVSLFYQKDVSKDGVKAYRFWGSNHTFANGTTIPGNECYCVKGTCAPMGLLNAESCRMGAPAFVSFPHYLNADPFLLEQVNGLSPEEDKHAFIMDIMPEVGIPVGVTARMQINMRVKPYPGNGILHAYEIDILKSVPDIYLPMLWFEQLAEVPADMSKELEGLQFILSTPILTIVFSVLLLIGVVMMTCAIYLAYRAKKFKPDEFDDDDDYRYPESLFGSTDAR